MINTVTSNTQLDKIRYANIALKHKLYVSGWQLSRALVDTRSNPSSDDTVCIANLNGKPVGVGLVHNRHLMIFVKKSCRRQGIGTLLVKRLKNDSVYSEYGIPGSQEFWKLNQIPMV